MVSGRMASVFKRAVEPLEFWCRLFLSQDYFLAGFLSHIKITGLAMKIVE